ncbi:MAG: murein biosynthesis integral membrane protein MurJ [Dictyoglomus sp.]|nr:murein biosynthesis integral membrane protein MurJ [Dictyoglomus sp.]MCX7941487.1 murein biosynthesis integral membrane protein MurJ [Dictyoglomaceae bacterium]MDW8189097.1 murein biosynthesis integral membrane protein MurJ [Dictyoglomus sp.]
MDKKSILQRLKRLFLRQSITEATILITLLSILSRILGFLREMMIAAFFGARKFTDSFVVAQAVPGILAGLVSGALSSVFIPLYAEWKEKHGKEEAERFANILLSDIFIILLIVTILSYLLSPIIITILAPGFNEETKNLSIYLSYIMLPSIIFWGTYGLISGIFNSQRSFFLPNLSGVIGNVIFIITIYFLYKSLGVYVLGWGSLANVVLQYIILLPYISKIGFSLKWELNFKYEGLKKALYLTGPIFIAQSIGLINMAVDRIFGSYLPEGSISALNYASRIYQLPFNLFVNALATATYTEFAFNAQSKDLSNLKISMEKTLRAVLFLVIPSTFGFIFLAKPIVQLAFERGLFDALATKRTSESLIFYSLGLISMSINTILVRVFFSLHDTKIPTKISIIALISNIVLNFIFIKPLAHMGLALATSCASSIASILLYRELKRKIHAPFTKELFEKTKLFTIGGFIIGIIGLLSYNFLSFILPKNQLGLGISVLSSVGLSVLIYLYLCSKWKLEEAGRIFNIIKRNLELLSQFIGLK